MGRAINNENRLDDHDREIKLIKDNHGRRLKLIEDALEEMIQTKVHHVDLHDEMDKHEEKIREENRELKPDEEHTVPVRKRTKTTKATATT